MNIRILSELDSDDGEILGYFERRQYEQGRKSRRLLVPTSRLKSLQRKLLQKTLYTAWPHHTATAFAKGRSIAQNARLHHRAAFLYKTDVISFFASIGNADVTRTLANHYPDQPPDKISEMTRLLTIANQLPQGAPTSPHISNLYMTGFDDGIYQKCVQLGATYLRYADDITISSASAESVIEASKEVRRNLMLLGLKQNMSKTRIFGRGEAKIVTGLDVSQELIRPPRKFRKDTTAMIMVLQHHYYKRLARRVHGRLSFWHSVCPSEVDIMSLRERFLKLTKERMGGQDKKILDFSS